jgi:hypothetical protein
MMDRVLVETSISNREESDLTTAETKPARRQFDDVKVALKDVERAEKAHEKCLSREKQARAQYEAAKARAKGSNLKRLSNAALTARHRAEEATKLRIEAGVKLREVKKILREQEQLVREAERKERARDRAVAAFLKKWEREYDLDMRRKKKNIRLRKQEIQTD